MSTTIEFFKLYSRRSRSPDSWNDRARVVVTLDPETKQGVYLHLGDFGINGIAVSSQLQKHLPECSALKKHKYNVERATFFTRPR